MMVTKTEKLIAKLSKKELATLKTVLGAIECGNITNLNIKKLRGANEYRVRKGKLRIRFIITGGKPHITKISRRNKSTYRDL